jgi:hypothetical protein
MHSQPRSVIVAGLSYKEAVRIFFGVPLGMSYRFT